MGADARARPLAAAGALFFDDDGQLLIVEPGYRSTWDIPGGMIERGETPRKALERELREELGLVLDVGRLLVVDWVPSHTGQPDDHVEFVFDGGRLADERLDAIDLPPGEPLRTPPVACEVPPKGAKSVARPGVRPWGQKRPPPPRRPPPDPPKPPEEPPPKPPPKPPPRL